MTQIPETWCSCEKSFRTYPKLVDHYAENFIPTGWALEYGTLGSKDDERTLYIMGHCLRCHQTARAGVSIPSYLTGDALFEQVYTEQCRYRPFDGRNQETGAYRGALESRLKWYQAQDDLLPAERNAQFIHLFRTEDQEAARQWLAKRSTTEEYTKPRRDRRSTLLYETLEQARAAGSMAAIDPILDYILPNQNEPERAEHDILLTDYRFNIVPVIQYGGSEGIYVCLYLDGKFDNSGNTKLRIGTFKTLQSDLAACRRMGELCGVLLYYATAYVNENIHRYTPEWELQAEYQRKFPKTNTPAANNSKKECCK